MQCPCTAGAGTEHIRQPQASGEPSDNASSDTIQEILFHLGAGLSEEAATRVKRTAKQVACRMLEIGLSLVSAGLTPPAASEMLVKLLPTCQDLDRGSAPSGTKLVKTMESRQVIAHENEQPSSRLKARSSTDGVPIKSALKQKRRHQTTEPAVHCSTDLAAGEVSATDAETQPSSPQSITAQRLPPLRSALKRSSTSASGSSASGPLQPVRSALKRGSSKRDCTLSSQGDTAVAMSRAPNHEDMPVLVTSKSARLKLEAQPDTTIPDHPIRDLLTAKRIDIRAVQEKLEDLMLQDEPANLDMQLSCRDGLPPPLFFAVGMKSCALVSLFIEHRADVRKHYNGKMWRGILKGMTPLDATVNFKLRFQGTMLADQYAMIEDVLRAEEARQDDSNTAQMTIVKASSPHSSDDNSELLCQEAHAALERQAGNEVCKRMSRDSHIQVLLFSSDSSSCQHHLAHPSCEYELQGRIGKGTFGDTRQALHRTTNTVQAMRTVGKGMIEESGVWQEVQIMRMLSHPNIACLIATFEDTFDMFLVMEFCEGGHLMDALLREPAGLTEANVVKLSRQMLAAVCYLHGNSICHRDLKPDNFLLSKVTQIDNMVVKLVDFGTARIFQAGEEMRTKICTPHYVAPEVLCVENSPYTEKCDVWSMGVIIYLLLSGKPPFVGDTDYDVLKAVKKGSFGFCPSQVWGAVSNQAKSLLRMMLVVKPEIRCRADEAEKHFWFEEQSAKFGSGQEQIQNCGVGTELRTFLAHSRLQQVAARMIEYHIDDKDLDNLLEAFTKRDSKRSGKLNISVMRDVIKKRHCSHEVQREMLQLLCDMTKNEQEVQYKKFMCNFRDLQSEIQSEASRAAFKAFDINGDNQVSSEELTQLFASKVYVSVDEVRTLGGLLGLGTGGVEALVKEVDKNFDAQVNYEEFCDLLYGDYGLAVRRLSSQQSLTEQLIELSGLDGVND